jgi:histidinol dehydrogenase
MEIVINPSREQWRELTARNIPDDDAQLKARVADIISQVATRGDEALQEFASRFDGLDNMPLELTADEIAAGAAQTAPKVADAIRVAYENISKFHRAQLPAEVDVTTVDGVRCLQRAVPINRVGLYIPGGRAPLFSTVLMLAIPAKIAGCKEILLCTPQGASRPIAPEILFAAQLCGIDRVFRVGGAQAIAAMAYGTASIPQVDKIFGPGNRYVTTAKQMVTNITSIDMPAGPSEVMVLADSSAVAAYAAADMLSQAEHGPDSQALLVCHSEEFALAVKAEVERQAALLSRSDSVAGSLSKSRIIVLPERDDMIAFANCYAAEHLIIQLANPWEAASKITAAGSVFIGNYSPESAGDYASGTNHTLPTCGWARSYSGVNIDGFIRKITYQQLSPDGLASLSDTIITMAEAEGLDAHAAAVKVRLSNPSKA